ncbi:hypothetical protein HPB48_005444 [Haemaphysalis longicornis]|uniref:Uncharacterized protein n=1 Tax=Haemaphysalis longicornis TaxID=44386 RepID=A0A9J6GNF7_HAELO|nr:hypothetical protein HPB48_005444 [Haemaphysalis longicornis]
MPWQLHRGHEGTRVRAFPSCAPSSRLPKCPGYMSREATKREDPDSKRASIEHAALQNGIAESNEVFYRASGT